jgi:trk system potassium uptake protein TrkA
MYLLILIKFNHCFNLDIRRKYNLTVIGVKKNDVMNFTILPETVLTKDMNLLVLGEYKALKKCFRF